MKKHSLLFFCLLVSACGQGSKVPRTSVKLSMLNSEIIMTLPGELAVLENCLVLSDPHARENNINVLDKTTGELKHYFLKKGQGPQEFVSPILGSIFNDSLIVYDVNANKFATFNTRVLCDSPPSVHTRRFLTGKKRAIVNVVQVDSQTYYATSFSNKHPFSIIRNGEEVGEFGNYPVEESVSNPFDVFQGRVFYNAQRRVLVYGTFGSPYLALYDCSGKTPRLRWEARFGKNNYSINENMLRWDDDQYMGIFEITFTKDYITCLVLEKPLSEAGGLGKETLPKTIYVYDYNGKLLKVLELDYHCLRMGALTSNNFLYLVGQDEEYALFTLDLDQWM